ncbi:MAG: DNA glycosylase AlkZ-like family protein [Armatimonadota bacterium]
MRIALSDIERLRAHRWRTQASRHIGSERGALRLIEELGFVLLVSIGDEEMPSIHAAAGGDWGVWWDWKQTLPERKACYYAKVLRRRGTFISWQWFPAFYRAYADPRPYWRLYRDGLLDRAEKQVLDLLADRGPMMTRELRLQFGTRSKENTRRVKSILVDLQTRFLVTTAGGDTSGWSHHRWDLVERWAPARSLTAAARLSPEEARSRIIEQFIVNMVATSEADICWTFGWERRQVRTLVAALLDKGKVQLADVPEMDIKALVPKPFPGRRR